MPHFNKRHYQQIAMLLQGLCPDLPRVDGEYDDAEYEHDALGRQLLWDDLVDQLCELFANDNHLFKDALFRQACQPGANVRARKVELANG